MGFDNHAYIGDEYSIPGDYTKKQIKHENNLTSVELTNKKLSIKDDRLQLPVTTTSVPATTANTDDITKPQRESWGNEIEFLMSCIAMSVGLGNVWRFPFTALENGGGAFLIPYLIVLFIVGRPIYYMEMCIGQFSSRGSAKVFDMVPALRGVGYGQLISVLLLNIYYASLMAIIFKYLIDSFYNPLPWSYCRFMWVNCLDSVQPPKIIDTTSSSSYINATILKQSGDGDDQLRGSSELYFTKEVLKEVDNIENGIGLPDGTLVMCLAVSWLVVLLILIKGVQSSGKASYFLALFPYVVMGILLVRACTLPGAADGIIYFIKPQWDKILSPTVWYAAVTQCFFSLSVCFGNIIMYSSFNKFNHNVYRDVTIITLLDTFTSLLAGFTIFGILGHLAHEIGTSDVGSVVKGGTGLAFISYPDAIAKFEWMPQVFSVLFFFMLFVLGVGSNIAMTSCVMTVIRDQFPKVKHWQCACCIAAVGLALGCVYLTPGGQFVLNLVDFFGASLIAFVLAIAELIAIGWIYGVDRLCKDIEFMIGRNPGIYWRLCWGIITPILMISILIYTIVSYEPLTYKNILYPNSAYAAGWTIAAFGIFQLPLWAIIAIVKQKGNTWSEKICGAFEPTLDWGPRDPATFERYKKHTANIEANEKFLNHSILHRMKRNVFG